MAGKWWEYLPEDQYRDWQANKWKQQQIDRLNSEMEQPAGELPAVPEGFPEPTAQPSLEIPGFGWGGKIKSLLGDAFDTATGALGDAGGAIADTYRTFQRNVVDPGAGIISDLGFRAGDIRNNPIVNPGGYTRSLGSRMDLDAILDTSWTEKGRRYRDRDDLSGFDRFGAEVLADPTTYLGAYGSAVSRIPGLGRVGRGIKLLEDAPGKGVDVALRGVGKGTEAGLSKVGLGKLFEETTSSKARKSGAEVAEFMRRMADKYGGAAATGDEGARVVGELKGRLRTDPAQLGMFEEPLDANEMAGWTKARDIWTKLPNYNDSAKFIREGNPSPLQFIQTLEDVGRRESEKAIKREIAEGRLTNPAAVQWLQNTGDKVFEGWQKTGGAMTKGLSKAILGTAGYPVGNLLEEQVRAANAGLNVVHRGGAGVTTREFLERAAPFENVPASLYAGSPVKAELGVEGKATSLPGKIWDVASGSWFVDISRNIGDRTRRDFWIQAAERGYQEALAKGADEAAARVLGSQAANGLLLKTFPNSDTERVVDLIAKQVFPFWTYASQRPGYLARFVSERPGVLPTHQKYQEHTNEGNIPVGAAGLEFNPTRGSFLGMLGSLDNPDYPTFSTGTAGNLERGQQLLARGGLYPSTVANALLAAERAREGQPAELGSLLPNTTRVGLQALNLPAVTPGLENIGAVEGVSDFSSSIQQMLGDRFYERAVRLQLAEDGIEPEQATPEQILDARAKVGARQAGITEAGFFRYRPEELTQYREDVVQEALRAGIPEAQARELGRTGNPLSATDEQGNRILTAATQREIYDRNPDWERWRQVSDPLKRPEERQALDEQRTFFTKSEEIDQWLQSELDKLYQREANLSGEQFREQRRALMTEARIRKDQALKQLPGAQALMDPAAREAFYQKTGRDVPGKHPLDQKASSYYDIQPEVNEQTGEPDWASFQAKREALLQQMTPEERDYTLNQYRQRQFNNPRVAAGEQRYEAIQSKVSEYFKMPKYFGLSEQQSQLVDSAIAEMNALRSANPYLSRSQVESMVMGSNPLGVILAKQADKLRNPARKAFAQANPEVLWYLSNTAPSQNLMASGLSFRGR